MPMPDAFSWNLLFATAGTAIARIQRLEGMRGDWAAWGLLGFGLAYLAWGVRKGIRHRRGIGPHMHGRHVRIHAHGGGRHHHDPAPATADSGGEKPSDRSVVTFWSLFIVFVLGPCEPLIPLFVLPASRGRWNLALATGLFFGAITVTLMVGVTLLAQGGLHCLPFGRLERWAHALAGGVIALSGAAVLFLGL